MSENLRTIDGEQSLQITHRSVSHNRGRLYKQLTTIFLLIVIFVIIITLPGYDHTEPPAEAIWFSTGFISLVIIWLIKQVFDLDWLNPLVVYAIVFWVFHFGLLFPASISSRIFEASPLLYLSWIDSLDTEKALLVSLLFLASFALGIMLFSKPDLTGHDKVQENESPELIKMGWFLIGLSFLLIVWAFFNIGWRIFLLRYRDFLIISTSFSWPIIIMATGIMLQLAGGRQIRAVLKTIAFLFIPIIFPVMLAGVRTAPLFTSAAILSVLSLRGLRIPLKLLIPSVFLLLTLIAFIKDVRQQGWESVLIQGEQIETQDPLVGLGEMGSSLAPVAASFDYIRTRGGFFYGETYLFPFIRQFERFAGTPSSLATDERFIAEHVTKRYAAFGFSTVAEAYVNGSVYGVFIFAFMWGAFLSWLTHKAVTSFRLAFLSIVLIPMFINVRNSFIYVPAWIFLGMCTIFVAFIAHIQREKKVLQNR